VSNPIEYEKINDINSVARFLGKRDIDELSRKELEKKFGITQVDMIIILGNSIPYIAELGAKAYKSGLARKIMIAGGIGHATKYLIQNVLQDSKYTDIDVIDKSEAEILSQIIVKNENVEKNKIIIESKSTNCGSNAQEALKLLKAVGEVPKSIILMQDPAMQLRSHASFLKEWGEEKTIISYSPFIPMLVTSEDDCQFANGEICGLWTMDRFIDLIMGEIPRLKDDENGYGPRGRGYIVHVDIPQEVINAYERLLTFYTEYSEIKNRK
jgi:uncharacterized SAM-binding protein YcdF (DUF218 family)